MGIRGFRVRQPEEAEARRRSILLAAGKVFAQKGYWSATLDDVAEEMGVTKTVIYYYFRSKEEVYAEIRVTATIDNIKRLRAVLERGGSPEQMLRGATSDLLRHVLEGLEQYSVLIQDRHVLTPENRARLREVEREYEELVRGIVEQGVRAGVFAARDPKVTAFTIIRAVLGVANWYSPDGPLPPPYIIQHVTEQLISGVLRTPAE